MYLETSRCIIRPLTTADLNDLYETLSDEIVMKYIEPPFSMKDTESFIESAGLCEPPLVYAVVWQKNNKVIGHVIFHPYEEDSFEIGWILNRAYWGNGIAGEITGSLLEYAKTLAIGSCVIECDPEQTASIRIAQKHGFIYESEDDGCSIYRFML